MRKQQHGAKENAKHDKVGDDQQHAQKKDGKGHIDGVSADGEHAGCHQSVGLLIVYADAEPIAERTQAEKDSEFDRVTPETCTS